LLFREEKSLKTNTFSPGGQHFAPCYIFSPRGLFFKRFCFATHKNPAKKCKGGWSETPKMCKLIFERSLIKHALELKLGSLIVKLTVSYHALYDGFINVRQISNTKVGLLTMGLQMLKSTGQNSL